MILGATAAVSIGCGGSSGSGTTAAGPEPEDTASAASIQRYVARAEPICRQSNAAVRTLAVRLPQATAAEGPGDAVAKGLVKPGIEILEQKSARLRSLDPPPSQALGVYLGLFDPILELSRQLLVMRETGDINRAREIELLIVDLGREQAELAETLGFDACAVDFMQSLGGSA